MTDTYTIEWESRDGRTHRVTAPTLNKALVMYKEVDVLRVQFTNEDVQEFRDSMSDAYE